MKLYKHAITYKRTAEELIATIKLIKSTDFKVKDVNVDLHKHVAAAIAQGHFTSYNMLLFHESQHAALINEALVARVLHAAFRARSECSLSCTIFHSHRTNALGSCLQSKRSGMELEL